MIAAANPLRSLAADAAAVADVVRAVDGPVVLAAHSYGGSGDLERPRRRRRDRRARLRLRLRARARRALLPARGHVPGQHARRRRRRGRCRGATERPTSTSLRTASTSIFCQDVPAPQAARMAVTQRPGHAGGAHRAVRRAAALARGALVVPDRRGGPHHPRRRSSATWPSAPTLTARSRSRAPRTRSPSRAPRPTAQLDPRGRGGGRARLNGRNHARGCARRRTPDPSSTALSAGRAPKIRPVREDARRCCRPVNVPQPSRGSSPAAPCSPVRWSPASR